MKLSKSLIITLLSTILFIILFYNKSLGLNLVIFEFLSLIWLFYIKELQLKSKNVKPVLTMVIITALFTILHHSLLSFVVNYLTFFLLIGVINNPQIKSLFISLTGAIVAFGGSQKNVRAEFQLLDKKGRKRRIVLRKITIYLLPIILILFFIIMYSNSNPIFGKYISSVTTYISEKISYFFSSIELSVILTLIIGWFISVFVFIRSTYLLGSKKDAESSDMLQRQRMINKNRFKVMGLKYENQSAVFLFISLNVLLFSLNFLDFKHVWLGFEWKGQFLKQFVHNGTFFLIATIIVSVLLVLIYFRKNQNFYSKNKRLKLLTQIWVIQNVFLSISVAIRNFYYIKYYALAYGRIGVILFVLLAIAGLITVFIKINSRKSAYYLLRINTIVWLIAFTLLSGFNWDRIIAKYNFSKGNSSFIHLNFLSELSDTALPYLNRPIENLEGIDIQQQKNFSSSSHSGSSFSMYKRLYMTPEYYVNRINKRTTNFKKKWEEKSWLEWNWAESRAYSEIKEVENPN